MDRVDDLALVGALKVDRGDSEVGVSELALNDGQRNAFAGHLDGVRVAKLMGRETAPDSGFDSQLVQRFTGR
jgi:hypothetical protein